MACDLYLIRLKKSLIFLLEIPIHVKNPCLKNGVYSISYLNILGRKAQPARQKHQDGMHTCTRARGTIWHTSVQNQIPTKLKVMLTGCSPECQIGLMAAKKQKEKVIRAK